MSKFTSGSGPSTGIQTKASWKRLESHVEEVRATHLRTLLQDPDRCASLTAEFQGIVLDYSRQNVLPQTMDMLFDLAAEVSQQLLQYLELAHGSAGWTRREESGDGSRQAYQLDRGQSCYAHRLASS